MERRFISLKKIEVAAGAVREFSITGKFFRVKESTEVFEIQTDQNETFSMEKGLGFGDLDHRAFNSIIFRNLSATNVLVVSFYVSNVPIDDSRVSYVYSRPAPTYAKAISVAVTDAADYAIPNTNTRTGKSTVDTLSHVIITNNNAGVIDVKDSAGTVGLTVTDFTIVQVTTKDTLNLRAAAGSGPWTIRLLCFYNYDAP